MVSFLSLLLVLTGCETAYNVTYALLSEKTEKDLTNKDSISIVDCYGKTMGEKHRAPSFGKKTTYPKAPQNLSVKTTRLIYQTKQLIAKVDY